MIIRQIAPNECYTMENYVQNFMQSETPETYLEAAIRDSIAIIIEAEKSDCR